MNHYSVQLKLKNSTIREATGPKVANSEGIAKLFEDLKALDKEAFFVVTLNQKNKIIDKHLISLGSLTASLVHPREVFKPAILDSAAAIAFVHNHPSGDTTPSNDDKKLTERLRKCGELLGLRILDHVIVGKGHFSFCEEGIL